MIGKNDFHFRDDITKTKEGDTVALELKTGPYKGVIFRYTQVQIQEQETNAVLKFQYELIEMGDHTETKLRKDPRFTEHLGILLNHLILEAVDADRENHPEELDEERGVLSEGSAVSEG